MGLPDRRPLSQNRSASVIPILHRADRLPNDDQPLQFKEPKPHAARASARLEMSNCSLTPLAPKADALPAVQTG